MLQAAARAGLGDRARLERDGTDVRIVVDGLTEEEGKALHEAMGIEIELLVHGRSKMIAKRRRESVARARETWRLRIDREQRRRARRRTVLFAIGFVVMVMVAAIAIGWWR